MLAERQIRRGAGVSATREYERLKREWRHRNRRLFGWITAICSVVIAAALVASGGEIRGWLCGLVAGMSLAFLVLVRESAPGWIDQHLTGAVGEERTAKALEPVLRAGWFIAHDFGRGQGRARFNIDHVLVGPGGVFVVETKNLSGEVAVDGDQANLTRPGGDRPAYQGNWWAREARSHAAEASAFFRQRVRVRPWVTAVVVLWADFPQGQVDGDRVTFIVGEQLCAWLQSQPKRLTPEQVDRLRAALEPRHRQPAKPVTPAA